MKVKYANICILKNIFIIKIYSICMACIYKLSVLFGEPSLGAGQVRPITTANLILGGFNTTCT